MLLNPVPGHMWLALPSLPPWKKWFEAAAWAETRGRVGAASRGAAETSWAHVCALIKTNG